MRLVSAGVFRMGTPRDDPMMGFDERVLSAVEVPAFCIDTFEYPNKRGVSPTASVGFADAKRLCESQSKRLCSESEWEKSCKGNGGALIYSYQVSLMGGICSDEGTEILQ